MSIRLHEIPGRNAQEARPLSGARGSAPRPSTFLYALPSTRSASSQACSAVKPNCSNSTFAGAEAP